MEYLITILPIAFSLLTGILVSWGLQLGMCMFSTIHTIHHLKGYTRQIDLFRLFTISLITTSLFILLFFTPTFTATHMITLLFMEIWYAIFLFFISETTFMGEVKVKELEQRYTETVVHFDRMRKHS